MWNVVAAALGETDLPARLLPCQAQGGPIVEGFRGFGIKSLVHERWLSEAIHAEAALLVREGILDWGC